MGAVYRARDLHFPNVNRVVALKEMVNQARDILIRNTIVRNFEREADLLATLDHPSIPSIYDYFTFNERSYLILEFINGKDLDTLLKEESEMFTFERIVRWGIELCDVLQYLHTHQPEPIIFRDMKPSNVMINQHGHVVLVDFGIAKPFQGGQKGTMIGTEGYSPPEQYRGEATHLADIYALGATLHHLLTKRDPRLEPPFSFGERPIRQLNPEVSLELETVVTTALQYSPGDRFPSARAMKDALMNSANTIPTNQIDAAYRHTGDGRPSKPRLAAAGESMKPSWSFTCEDEIRGTPACYNGAVYIGSYDNNLYALETSSGKFLWKYATDGGIVSRPAVHDQQILFGSEDKRLHVITLRSGKINWTYYTKGPLRSSPYIAEGHAFIGSDDASLHAVNILSGRKAWQIDAGGAVRSTPTVSQDLIYIGTEAGDFFCLDFRGNVKWRFQAKRAVTSSPIVWQGVVYFGSVDSHLYALDAKTGWVIWRLRLGKATISSPCIASDIIFTGATDGKIYAIDSRSSKEVWHFGTEHQVTGSPIIYKDSLYCGSVDGYLYCLEYRTGRLRWKLRTGGPITGTPAAADDMIFIGSTDHQIYAVSA
jgi:outer membrane protein assembly factor BamB